jgi:hypothetical protein
MITPTVMTASSNRNACCRLPDLAVTPRLVRVALLTLGMLISAGGLVVGVRPAAAQVPTAGQGQGNLPNQVGGRQGQQNRRVNRDSVVRDSLRKLGDTTHKMVKWLEPDSVMQSLLDRPDFQVTRYQGANAQFNASNRELQIEGRRGYQVGRSAVLRDSTLVVGDSIIYNDSTQIVTARGDTVYLHDPKSNADGDVVSIGQVRYDVAAHTALITNVYTEYLASGQRWFIHADRGAYAGDTTGKAANTFYGRSGDVTTCDDSEPHYHIRGKELKYVSKHILVIRPAILYIADVPILWLPFVFQDLRTGRRSGILTPRFGFNEIIRNSPTYRRNFSNLGYYFDINDYTDATVWIDWRSEARPQPGDPGFWQYNGEFRYHWLDRFVEGDIAWYYRTQSDGTNTFALYWNHRQDFSQKTHLTMDINYVSTTIDQQNIYLNPYAALANITSQVAYQTQIGPSSISIGGTQTQYPGRTQVDRTFPTVSLTSKPVTIGKWLTWTPSLSGTNVQSLNIDQVGAQGFFYTVDLLGNVDSTTLNRSTRNTTLSFDTPIKIFNFNWRNSFQLNDKLNGFPVLDNIYVAGKTASGQDTAYAVQRTYEKAYSTSFDWTTGIDLPTISQGRWNFVPSVTVVNADASVPFINRTEISGADYEVQQKRLVYGLQASPTFYALFPGFLGISRFRSSVSPLLSFNYSGPANVSQSFLLANATNPSTYLGNLKQETVTLSFSTNLEAKFRDGPDTNPDNGTKIKLASLAFDPVTYDFGRASYTIPGTTGHPSGITNQNFGYTFRTDLIPGFNFRESWSLFQGDPSSDTAKFSPYPTQVSASLSFGKSTNPLLGFAKLLGFKVNQKPVPDSLQGQRDPFLEQQIAAQHAAGQTAEYAQYAIPNVASGWLVSLNFTETQQRPPEGNLSNVIQYNPTVLCAQYLTTNPLLYAECIQIAKTNPLTITNGSYTLNATTQGSPYVRVPAQTALSGSLAFAITPRWSAQWQSTYAFTQHGFSSNVVTLQRDLHDWRAVFSFTQSPTGSFGFTFFVALKAEPALKFNYDRTSFRAPGD